jgi:hypothetical protein
VAVRGVLAIVVVAATALAGPAPALAERPLVDRSLFGTFVGTSDSDPRQTVLTDPSALPDFERRVGARVQVLSLFHGRGDVFPDQRHRALADGGRRALLIAWDLGDDAAARFPAWSRGRHDEYLRTVAAAAAAFPHPLYVRPWPEMNADWVPFQPTSDGTRPAGGTPREFIAAWRHLVTVFRAEGATNVRWVFNPTTDTYAETTHVRTIWPGANYVDVLGLDGYNWGTYPGWRSFDDVFATQYRRLTRLDRALPVWICEVGSREPTLDDGAPADPTKDKGRWLRAMLAATDYERVEAVVHFDVLKERDWRLDSSSSSWRTVRSQLAARPAPVTRSGRAALGTAGLAPTRRRDAAGHRWVDWAPSGDPGTSRYRVQERGPGGWTTVHRTSVTAWRRDDRDAGLPKPLRIQGVGPRGVRWTSAVG